MNRPPRPSCRRLRDPVVMATAASGVATCLVACSVIVAGAVAAGCGGERLYPVSLAVILPDGTPAAGCSVMLRRDETPVVTAGGRIAGDGSCTPVVPGRTSPGLPAGTYRVTLLADTGPPTDGSATRPLPFAGRYTNPEHSGLRVSAGPGCEQRVTLRLDP